MTAGRRWISVVALVLVAAGCADNRLTIAVHSGVEGVALKLVASEFVNGHGVEVEIVELPYGSLYESALGEVRRESGWSKYDVIMMDDPWFPALLAGHPASTPGKLRLEKLNVGADDRADFVPVCLDVCRNPDTMSEDLYALPFVGNSQLFAYRGAKVAEAHSWKEIINLPQPEHGLGYVMRVGRGNSIVTDFMPVLWSAWAGIESKELPVEATKQAFRDFRNLGSIKTLEDTNLTLVAHDDFDLAIHLVKGTASISIVWSAWAMAVADAFEKERIDLHDPEERLHIGPVPGGQPTLGAWLLGVPANARNKSRAKEFVQFATSREQIIEAARFGNPPPRRSALEALRGTYPWLNCQLQSLEHARPRPRTVEWKGTGGAPGVEDRLGELLSDLYAGRRNEDQTFESARVLLEKVFWPSNRATSASDASCGQALLQKRPADGPPAPGRRSTADHPRLALPARDEQAEQD